MLPKVNISLADGSMRRLFPYSLVLLSFQIIIWLRLSKTAHIPTMNAQVRTELPAQHGLVLQTLGSFMTVISGVTWIMYWIYGTQSEANVSPNSLNGSVGVVMLSYPIFSIFRLSVSADFITLVSSNTSPTSLCYWWQVTSINQSTVK